MEGGLSTDSHVGRRLAEVESGSLTDIVRVARATTHGAVEVELHSIEIRKHGGFLLTRARRSGTAVVAESSVGGGSAEPDLTLAEPLVAMQDDVGTLYGVHLFTADTADSVTWRHRLAFQPSPPRAARHLTVFIHQFGPGSIAGDSFVQGPWRFSSIRLVGHAEDG